MNVETPGNDIDGAARDNPLSARVDLSGCGRPPRATTGVVGIALETLELLDERTATDAVFAGLNRMLLDRGYRDAEETLSKMAAACNY